jgi:glycerol-3-phosphate dehydrogenase (NAD(P)+)
LDPDNFLDFSGCYGNPSPSFEYFTIAERNRITLRKEIVAITRVSIIGSGSWGTALTILLARSNHNVTLWSRNRVFAETLQKTRVNDRYLPDIRIPDSVRITSELTDLSSSEVVLFVSPSAGLRDTAKQLAETAQIGVSTILVSAVKGIEHGTGLRMSEIIAGFFPSNPIAALSGPNHAEEVAQSIPTASVLASASEEDCIRLQRTISNRSLRLYTNEDIIGVELGGALKNVFAIAAGIGDGLGLGDNTKAALVTRSLAELARLGSAMGGNRETFQGLSGLGDLMVTCFSRHSRNRKVGERLGRGESLPEIISSMSMVAEGIPTTRSAHECAVRLGVETPIIDVVHAILYEGATAANAIGQLMMRDLRPE